MLARSPEVPQRNGVELLSVSPLHAQERNRALVANRNHEKPRNRHLVIQFDVGNCGCSLQRNAEGEPQDDNCTREPDLVVQLKLEQDASRGLQNERCTRAFDLMLYSNLDSRDILHKSAGNGQAHCQSAWEVEFVLSMTLGSCGVGSRRVVWADRLRTWITRGELLSALPLFVVWCWRWTLKVLVMLIRRA